MTRRSPSWPTATPTSTTPSGPSPPTTCGQACDLFTATYEHPRQLDGRVSIEVDPRLAHDTDATIAQALELWKIVDRPNVLIKIPATQAGPAGDHRA